MNKFGNGGHATRAQWQEIKTRPVWATIGQEAIMQKATERLVIQVTPAEKRAILDYCARHDLQVSAHTRKLWSDEIDDYPDVRYSQGQTVERDS